MSASDAVRRSLVVTQGTLIRVYPARGEPYWIRDGLIGTDDPIEDVTHWHRVEAGRLSPVKSMTMTADQDRLIEAVIEAEPDEV